MDINKLKNKAMELNSGCECMVDREKGEMKKLVGVPVTINDFDFLTDSEKGTQYVVFTVKEDDTMFFFGGTVLTDKMKEFEKEGYKEVIQKEGLPVLFGEKQPKDKKKQPYTTVEFFPEAPATKKSK
jgi:hypothetical protein